MSSTTTQHKIGTDDIELYDGVNDTFTRLTSTGGSLTLNKVGTAVNVAEVYGNGTISQTALIDAVNAIGTSRKRILILKSGTWSITSNLTIPSNFILQIPAGAILNVATGVTLTINAYIEAGPYQIFSWVGTGAIDISGSPTSDCPIEWWGAVTGTGEDNAAIFTKVQSCVGSHQNVRLGPYIYRIASAVSITKQDVNGFGLMGPDDHQGSACIMVDTTGAVGLTIGESGHSTYYWRLKNINFIGEAACATTLLQMERVMYSTIDNINIIGGSTDYSMIIKGCESSFWNIGFGLNAGYIYNTLGVTYGTMANGLKITSSGGYYNNTFNDMTLLMSGTAHGAIGLYLDNVSTNYKIRGDIESCTSYSVYMDTCANVTLENIYVESCGNVTTGEGGFYITDCRDITIRQCTPQSGSVDGSRGWADQTIIKGSYNITLDDCKFGALTIHPSCYNITVRNACITEPHGYLDFSGSAEIIGGIRCRDSVGWFSHYGTNTENVLKNVSMSKFTASAPYGWAKDGNTTYTQCGTGLGDTTRHASTYCTKAVNTDTVINSYTLSTEERQAILGCHATGAMWAMIPSGQTFTTNALGFYIHIDAPSWATGTAYIVGEAVEPTSPDGYQYVCVTAGTSHATTEPTWASYSTNDELTDGTVTWLKLSSETNTFAAMPTPSAKSDDLWRKYASSVYVPINATTVMIYWLMYAQTGGNSTFYIAEPSVNVGNKASSGLMLGRNEFPHVQIAANRIDFDGLIPTNASSKIYGLYSSQGDVVFNTGAAHSGKVGWVCTGAGTNGTDAVWYTFGAID